jgi:hypothetical protein
MFRSTARFSCLVAAVVMAGCAFKSNNQAGPDAASPMGSGGTGAGTGGGAGSIGAGGKGGGPVIITNGDAAVGDGSVMGSLDSNCGTKTQSAKMLPPDIMLVMDRSLSMTDDINDRTCDGGTGTNGNCGSSSKWEIVLPVLTQVITGNDAKVNWGMYFLGDEPATCGVATTPVVPIAAMNASAVTTTLAGVQFNGQTGTPTRRVLQASTSYLTGLTDQNPKFMLLATDGEPNCATTSASSLNMDDATGTDQAVKDALAMGIPTFVVGIGNTNAAASLNQLAMDGGKPQTGGTTSYYQVNDAAALSTALSTIVGQAASCSFNIGTPPDGTTAVGLGVFGDGNKITMDPSNGWSFKDTTMTTIILNGSICDQVMNGTVHDVTVAFVCMPG